MGFKINKNVGFVPDGTPSTAELADFIELKAILSDEGRYSITDAISSLGIGGDESINNENIFGDTDEAEIEDSLSEIDNRRISANEKYPFHSTQFGIILDPQCNDVIKDVYTFLLLVTRVNMNTLKIQNGIDGTKVFEVLCSAIVENYWGHSAKSFVIGTGAEINDFEDKMTDAIKKIGEPNVKFRWPTGSLKREKDAKVDVVAYIPFSDDKQGRFVALGQCKTGTNWHSAISQLVPQAFNQDYFEPPLTFTPVVLFMVSEAFFNNWESLQRNSNGLLFDRCRLMQYLPLPLDAQLLDDIKVWNKGVIDTLS